MKNRFAIIALTVVVLTVAGCESKQARVKRLTFADTEAEIAEAVDFVVHVERQQGRRVVREVLALRGFDRGRKCFLMEPVFEVQHARN